MADIDILKAKLVEWKHRLGRDDVHSIGKQIAQMLWRSAFYRSVNESRRFLPDGKDGGKEANGLLHELVDEGYLTTNSTAIRRLLDKSATSGPRGVYSLYGLMRDIRDHHHLVTRANVLEARGLVYDFEPIRERAYRDAMAKGSPAFFVSRDGWAEAEHWHRVIDELCRVSANNRGTGDTPDQNKLEWLLNELEERGRIVQGWVDKFIAHAASPESRQTLDSEQRSLSLAKLWLAERVVVRAANFISFYIVDGTNIGGVPIPQFDQFVYLDQPFIQPTARSAMQQAWDQYSGEIRSCEDWFWDRPLVDGSDVWQDGNE